MIEWLSQYSGYVVLVAFFSAFAGITFWAYRPANRNKLEQHRDIPFNEAE